MADKWERGLFRCARPHFLAQKKLDFSKFMVCPHGQGVEPVRTSFMDGPLWCIFFVMLCFVKFYALCLELLYL